MSWKKICIPVFILTIVLAIHQLINNTKEPNYVVQGFLSTKNSLKTQNLRYVFLSIHINQEKMPYAAGRIFLRQDLSDARTYFILDDSNLKIIQKDRPFPEVFNLKITLSKSDKIQSDDSLPKYSQLINHLKIKSKDLNIVF